MLNYTTVIDCNACFVGVQGSGNHSARFHRVLDSVLGIILLAFTVFWTPFFLVNIISVFCPSCLGRWLGETDVMTTVVWWGYVSSTANPIVYTLFSEAFRDAFCRILTCKPHGVSVRRATSGHLGQGPPANTGPSVPRNQQQQQQQRGRVRTNNSVSFVAHESHA